MRRYFPVLRLVLLVLALALLAALAVRGPYQYGAFTVHTLAPGAHPSAPLESFPLNLAVFRWFNGLASPVLDRLFAACWYLGNGLVLVPVLLLLIAYRPGKMKYFLATVALETILVQALKFLADQPRPLAWLDGVRALHPLYSHSFPSGDAAMAFAVACSLLPGESRWWKAGLLLYAGLIVLERVYVGVHFPLDVLAGVAVGTVSAWIIWRLPWRQPAVAGGGEPAPTPSGPS
jgi:undecaprenyl-diphosphatase